MLIQVRSLSSKKVDLDVEPTANVGQVKVKLQEKEGIDRAQIRLIYGGRQLDDEEVLQQVGIKAGDTLHMVLQLRGGGALYTTVL